MGLVGFKIDFSLGVVQLLQVVQPKETSDPSAYTRTLQRLEPVQVQCGTKLLHAHRWATSIRAFSQFFMPIQHRKFSAYNGALAISFCGARFLEFGPGILRRYL